MDVFNSREFYGYSLSEDPKLRTTTRNYEFKYNSSDHMERIISRVRKDREKKKERELLTGNDSYRKFTNRPQKQENSQIVNTPIVETQIGSCRSHETIVKIMSDEEIQEMISEVLHPIDEVHAHVKKISSEHCVSSIETKDFGEQQREEKLPQLSVEIVPDLQPHWVEIKPIEKSIANLFEIHMSSDSSDESSNSEDQSALNLDPKTTQRESGNIEINSATQKENLYFDALSFDCSTSEDLVVRNMDESNIDEESPPGSLISLDIEPSLNKSEQLEMKRVFGKEVPHVPKIQLENSENETENSENDEYSEEEMDENYNDEIQNDCCFRFEVLGNKVQEDDKKVKDINCTPRATQNLSLQPNQIFSPKTSRTSKKPTKTLKEAINRPSSNRNSTEEPKDMGSHIQIEELKQEKMKIFSKLTSIQEKMIKSMDELRISLVELSLPNCAIETKRREKNALEFSVRFSRNYLFPLKNMIDTFRLAPKDEYHSAVTNEPCVKVCGIYNLLNKALQCYQKQLCHFFTDSFPKKLDILLNLIKDATVTCLEKKIFDKRDVLIQSLLTRCDMFLEFITDYADSNKRSAGKKEMLLQSERRSRFKLPKTSSKWDLTMSLNNLNMYEPKLIPKKSKPIPQKKAMKQDSHGSAKNVKKPKKETIIRKNSTDRIALPIDDPDDTQVRKDINVDSVQLIDDTIANEPESELAKDIIETLQDITKDEVQQLFGPIVLNLDSILNSSDNPQTAGESILNVLRSKLQEHAKTKQLKIDEPATEKITQNRNGYQKEVTKKGTHSSRGSGKQQKQQQFKETRQNTISKANAREASCSSKNNVKEDSTEQTERYFRSELTTNTNTKCDKQSLRNIDIHTDTDNAAARIVSSTKQKTKSGAFLSTMATTTAKKPTPAPDTNEVGGMAAPETLLPSTPLSTNVLPIKLDDVMPPLPSQNTMTSEHCLDYSAAGLPVGLPRAHKFVFKNHKTIIGDGKHPKELAASQRNVRDGAANAIHRTANIQGAQRKNLNHPGEASSSSPVRNGATKSGEMQKLYHLRNALYAFMKHGTECETDNPNEIKTNGPDLTQKSPETDRLSLAIDEHNDDLTSNGDSQEKHTHEELQTNYDEDDIKAILEERNEFIERCKHDLFYTNPQFPQPWKVLSKISKVIAREIVDNFENDLSFGEESYVRDFLDMEIQN